MTTKTDNKTKPTNVDVSTFLLSIGEKRRIEAQALIDMMQNISGSPAVMWGPSIIGFGTHHYKYNRPPLDLSLRQPPAEPHGCLTLIQASRVSVCR
jgi:hypothetical protein